MEPRISNLFSRCFAVLLLLVLLTSVLPGNGDSVLAAPGDTTRVSVDSSGGEANAGSGKPAISDDGRYVTFQSSASNLVSGDVNGAEDIFVHDRQTGTTTLVSVDSSGNQANGGSFSPAISADGRFVAFYSDASNLVNNDTNGCGDIFVHDRQTSQTTRVSVSSSGVEESAPPPDDYEVVSISGDGRFVAFYSDASNLVSGDTNGETDIFVHDRQTGETVRASLASNGAEANASSSSPALSSDGRYLAFRSGATNLVAGDTNGKEDIFVRDLQTGTTTRVSVTSSGAEAIGGSYSPDISGDGRYVVFLSASRNLDPRADDYGSKQLVFVHDRQVGQTVLASVYPDGNILEVGLLDQPTISRDGRYVAFAFYSKGDNNGIMNIWAHDLLTGNTKEVIYGNESSRGPALSANGSLVAFWSSASNLVSGDSNGVDDVFVSEVAYGAERNPTVYSITPECGFYDCPRPTPSNINFIATFSEQVTGVTADDFSLEMLDGVSGASITGVSGYGSQYYISVNTGTGDGELRLNLIDDDSIVDSTLNPLGGAGTGNGNKSGSSYYIDKSAPTVTSITRADPDPTAADTVHFTVNFSEKVYPVKPGDFVLSTTGSISGATVSDISPGEDEYTDSATYTVTVNTGTGDGMLRLDLIDDDSIRDQLDNPLGGEGAGNGDFTTGETYTINRSTPSTPSVTSSLRADPNPTAADIVSFSVTFSEAVSGVDVNDFALTTTGGISAAFVANFSGSGNSYTVLVTTGSGDGSLRLDVLDDDSIINASGIPLGGTGAGNGNFTTGESYTVDKSFPYVTSSLRTDANPTTAVSVSFMVSFSEAVSGVDVSDFSLSTTGNLSNTGIAGVSGSGNLYTISVNTGDGSGTLRLDILDNDSILDSSGYPLGGVGIGNGNFTTGEEYTIDRTPVELFTETLRSNGRNDGWVLESSEDSEQGGYKDSDSTTFVLGDNAQDSQFRAILHFPTFYIPNNAVITRALLMIRGEAMVGSDPFTTHGNILADIRSGAFGFIGPFPYRGLQISDFQSPAHMDAVATFENNPFNGWYWAWLDSSAFQYINLNGITQFRLRFQIGDDDNLQNDYMRFYSGDYEDLALRPRLVIEYYTSR